MALRKQPRSIARELALLSISQIKTKKNQLNPEDLDSLILAAIRTLIMEVQDNLETASAEIKRGEERLLNSETRASDLDSAKVMLQEALEISQTAVNRLGMAIEFPEFLQLTSREQVREYAAELIITVNDRHLEIEQSIENVLVAWQLSRLPQVDRDILRIAVAEILYLDVPERVAINESVELAKRYSDEDGFRFINGVLRRLSDRIKEQGLEAITTIEEEVKTEIKSETEDILPEEIATSQTEKTPDIEEVSQIEREAERKSLRIFKQTFADID
ncbi:transcription antitermination protein NusB [Waterburya agarophytonicola K14]|uniref:Transcription antitermination protein NusB n=1 Tax=Waterburya agarophytonicola KI4 TaxID=2874699 RepID=A0A964BRS2_9CYAN|nr:transcription antitermination factor NusB [Waterburya agarophytonicola]MCC0177001.1 transcription antitermination protein NusB [Waterburya agarophytonicola KI4]